METKKLTPSEAGRLGGFASRASSEARKQTNIANYNKNPKKCLRCQIIIDYAARANKYCSHSCATSTVNQRRGEKRFCEFCSKQLSGKRRHKPKYCNQECYFAHGRKEGKQLLIAGLLTDYQRPRIRRILVREFGYKCQICQITEWTSKPVPLMLDHIDGNSDNNTLGNLRLICCNCDGLLPTSRGRNRGKGRKYRRQLYLENKKNGIIV